MIESLIHKKETYMNSRTIHIAELAVFTAAAFIFSYIESLFPLPLPFPGMKLGLANLIIVIVLYQRGFLSAFGVSMVRNVLNAFTFGSLFSFFYSLAGSILSLCAMYFLKKNKHPQFSLIGASAVGGIIHNIGQFLVAVCLVGFSAILNYLPFLYFAGLIAGVLIGVLANLCMKRLSFLSQTHQQ